MGRRTVLALAAVLVCAAPACAAPGGSPSTGTIGSDDDTSRTSSGTSTGAAGPTGDAEGSDAEGSVDTGCVDADCCVPGEVWQGDACVPEDCTADACSGHGLCSELDLGIACDCDEGFTGARCDGQGDDFHRRSVLVPGLADPDILREHDDLFFLVGTGSTVNVPIFESTDLEVFVERAPYEPSVLDPAHDYCYVWAPDLARDGDGHVLHFSAHRVAKGAACPPGGQDVTTFVTTAPAGDLAFGPPALFDGGAGLPRSRVESGCVAEGCSRTVRIDSAVYDDGDARWFSYVWFSGGNNIATFRAGDPSSLVMVAGPATFDIAAAEERINEGPDYFQRDGRYYLFFSGGFFDSQYAMYYLMGSGVAELTRARNVRRHSQPLRTADGDLIESHGHNSVVERRGELFNVFHVGEFDGDGNLTGRSTHKQRLAFAPDGSIVALGFVDVRWSAVPGAVYSLDVVAKDGTVIGPCIATGRIGEATSARFTGICPDGGDVHLAKSELAAFRIYHSTDGTWAQHTEVPYDGATDRVFVPIDGGTTGAVELRWNELTTAAEYSLDVQRTDGSWIAPCVGAPVLGRRISHLFDGACPSNGSALAASEVRAFRVCSAIGGDWANATCGSTDHDGVAGFVDVAIPE